MKVVFSKLALPSSGALVVAVPEGGGLSPLAAELDGTTGGAITRALEASDSFKGKSGQSLSLIGLAETGIKRVFVVGLGKTKELKPGSFEALGGSTQALLAHCGQTDGAFLLEEEILGEVDGAEAAARLAHGAALRSYRFDKYRTKEKKEDKPKLKKFSVLNGSGTAAKKAYAPLEALAAGVVFTRDLVSEPANILYPESFVDACADLKDLGVEIEVLGEKEMKKLNMGALLGVAQGSVREPKLLIMRWMGGAKDAKPLAFVGKGVCFDTGGISIKPAGGMEDMKWDMGGAGVVAGLMKALAGRKAKANVIGICGLVENMPSGNAQRPGDVVTTADGQTVEVINTDAEGRLVLADALWYAQEKYKPELIVDLATLTGAIIISLGSEHAGLFSNNDALSESLTAAGAATSEKLWRLPLGDAYDKLINSDIADMKNVGNREGGSITAAQFLQRFITKKTPWAHLDIAGVTWSKKDSAIVPKGGTAFGVRLLNQFVKDNYEA
ncbi:MAG: leucyl aminopeptidase [Rhodospirillaceae bacterium]